MNEHFGLPVPPNRFAAATERPAARQGTVRSALVRSDTPTLLSIHGADDADTADTADTDTADTDTADTDTADTGQKMQKYNFFTLTFTVSAKLLRKYIFRGSETGNSRKNEKIPAQSQEFLIFRRISRKLMHFCNFLTPSAPQVRTETSRLRAGRMDNQRFRIRHIRQMRESLQDADVPVDRFEPAL
ncbi:hypothetical protein PACILC2_24590 [Paenibacillus cisolokensis]|uniref:Uncharacterized protein n=1 Tax=Paenibacillus cisolokensis TaxID=1658519 RepID=A0ABQ4N6U0_9BACL|nr:hypothetical protein [Paenibacillus cisolokensis]GIQ63891.1 hypothetical protein PACILC2_24590 [Paenibacillus cisolokensis]